MVICLHCYKKAYYNFNYEEYPQFCKDHKLNNMVNIFRKNCINHNCHRKAYYNYLGFYPKYCLDHKLDNMINVIFKKCIFENCNHRAFYNINGKSPAFCLDHKLINMINVSSKKCIFINCNKTPSYNYFNNKSPLYCSDHKLVNMIGVLNKICISINCNKNVTSKYDGYCPSCYIKLYPNKLLKTNTKEYNVINFILSKLNNYNWIVNQKIQSGSSNRRPDLHLILDKYSIIVEINEYQHKRYKSDSNIRILELSNDLNNKPFIIINFNPDNYLYNHKNIKSCWKYTNYYWILKDSKKEEWNLRLNILLSEIQKWLNPDCILDKNINIINLFYDNYHSNILPKSTKYRKSILNHTYSHINQLSDLSSDSNNDIYLNINHDITPIQEIYYFSDLSSDSDDHNINIYSTTPAVL